MAQHAQPERPRYQPLALAPHPSARWMRDEKVERHFDRHGVTYTYLPNVPLARIDLEASRHNNTRLTTHDPSSGAKLVRDVPEEYAALMRDGVVFPALVAYLNPDGIFGLLGGNHRGQAAKLAGYDGADLYQVTESDPARRAMIALSLNRLEGIRTRTDEAVALAARDCLDLGAAQTEMADWLGVSPKTISFEVRVLAARRALQHLDGVNLAKWSKVALERVGVLKNRNVRHAAAIAQTRTLFGTDSIRDMVNEINAGTTEAEQLAVVERWATRPEHKTRRAMIARGRPVPLMTTPKGRVLGALARVERLLRDRTLPANVALARSEDCAEATRLAWAIVQHLEGFSASHR